MANDLGGVWRTVGGRRIFIKDGEDLATAMKNSGKFGNKKEEKTKNITFGNSDLKETLTKDDEEILNYYVERAGAYDINYVLRNKDAIATENDKRAIKDLENTINKSTLNKDIETYRYISNENVFYNLKIGDVYEDKGFMSTTYNNNTDRENNFQDYKIKAVIKAKKGDSALDVSNLYDKKTDMPESEIIFNKNTKMVLKDIKEERDKYNEFSRKVYYFETKNETIKKDFTKMDRKELTTLLVDDQIKRNVIKPESRERQIKLRMTGSAKMSKTELIKYAEKYLK